MESEGEESTALGRGMEDVRESPGSRICNSEKIEENEISIIWHMVSPKEHHSFTHPSIHSFIYSPSNLMLGAGYTAGRSLKLTGKVT